MPSTEGSPTARWDGYRTFAVVIDDFLERLRNDPVLWSVWTDQRAVFWDRRVRQLTLDFIGDAIGGPTRDIDAETEPAPAGRRFTTYEDAALTRNLEATLEKFAVSEPDGNALRTLLSHVKSHIVKE